MAKIEVTKDQLMLIERALELYSRIGIGQLDHIKDHPTFERHLSNINTESGKKDWAVYHEMREEVDLILFEARNKLYNEFIPMHGSWGIHNPNVDESCRVAYDLVQVIRHELWKNNPDRSEHTVDSSVHLIAKDSNKIKVSI